MRVGLIGTGFAATAHADALRRIPDVEIVGVAGRTPEGAQRMADALGLRRAYRSWEELLEDETVDAVHNCTPNNVHIEITTAALDARKHVLAEKPLATTPTDSSALAEQARAAGLVAGVCFNYRFFPLVSQMRHWVQTGAFGPVHLVHGAYLQDWLLYDSDWNWRVDPEIGGPSRAVADIGSHWIDVVEHICGDRVSSLCADLATLHPVRYRTGDASQTFATDGRSAPRREPAVVETEDFATILLRFESGARGNVVVSQASAGRKNRLTLEIDAAQAAVAWDQEQPNHLWVGHRDGPNEELLRDPALLAPPAGRLTRLPGGHQEGWPDALRNLVADFYSAVSAHDCGVSYEPTFATFDDADHLVAVVDAVCRSAQEGTWQHVRAATEASR